MRRGGECVGVEREIAWLVRWVLAMALRFCVGWVLRSEGRGAIYWFCRGELQGALAKL